MTSSATCCCRCSSTRGWLRRSPDGWDIDDVAAGLVDKLVRRHPHVFADTAVSGSADVEANWDAIKKAEKPGRTIADGVPLALPALALVAKLQSRGTRAGSWSPPDDPAAAVTVEPARSGRHG